MVAMLVTRHPPIPGVLVVPDERTDDAGTIERLVRQYAENEHRAHRHRIVIVAAQLAGDPRLFKQAGVLIEDMAL